MHAAVDHYHDEDHARQKNVPYVSVGAHALTTRCGCDCCVSTALPGFCFDGVVRDVLGGSLMRSDALGGEGVAADVAAEELVPGAGTEIAAGRARVSAVLGHFGGLCGRPAGGAGHRPCDVMDCRQGISAEYAVAVVHVVTGHLLPGPAADV